MIARDIEKKIIDSLKLKEVTVLTGARQVGKTTVIKEVIAKLRSKGEKVLYFNLDIEQDSVFFDSQQVLLNKIQLECSNSKAYIFIDEIQQKKDAGRFLKGLYDMGLPYKFVVTGSGSLELKEKISEALTGRKYVIEMPPVSFTEFVNFKTGYKYKNRIGLFFDIEKEKTNLFLNEYLMFGGYPAIVTADNKVRKTELMNEIFKSYITKDISYLLGIRAPDKFVKLIQILSTYTGSLINFTNLSNETGLKTDTLKTYLWYAEQTFIINTVKPYFTNAKKEITKSPVVYFNDTGMCNYSSGRYGSFVIDKDGFIFQNFVYSVLKSIVTEGLSSINYWRTKDNAEVDFIVHAGETPIPVEVKYSNLKKPSVSRSFRNFIKKYSPKTGIIVNTGLEDKIKIGETTVLFVPYWKLFTEFHTLKLIR